MALTLAQAREHAPTRRDAAVISELAAGPLTEALPFENIPGRTSTWIREESIANANADFRNVNGSYAEGYAETSIQSESLRDLGKDLKVDNTIELLEGPEAKNYQLRAQVRATRMFFEKLFILGDPTTDPAQFAGLLARTPATSSQYIDNGGGGLDLGAFDEALDETDAMGGRKYLIMSRSARRALTRQTRANTQIDIVRSEFGYQQTIYAGIPILELDVDHTNTRILDSTPSSQDIYIVSFGSDHVTGIQNSAPRVRELGESFSKPELVTRMQWLVGLRVKNKRSLTRLANVDATVDP